MRDRAASHAHRARRKFAELDEGVRLPRRRIETLRASRAESDGAGQEGALMGLERQTNGDSLVVRRGSSSPPTVFVARKIGRAHV